MAKKEAKKENNKNKKSFFKDFKAELKKVVWPTPKQLVNNTVAVVSVVLVTAAIVFVLDLGFEALNKQGLNKIKEIVGTTNSTSENNENQTTEGDAETNSTEETAGETTSEEVTNSETTEQNNGEASNTQTETTEQSAETQNVTE